MIRYIKLKNFKSFENVEINLCNSKGKPKPIVFIYGNNGCGKSNLISSIMILRELLLTMTFREKIQEIFDKGKVDFSNNSFIKMIKKFMPRDLESIIQESKTVGTKSNMVMEFGFFLDGKNGVYIVETDGKQVVHERLDYRLSKNTRELFDCTPNNFKINSNLFETNEYKKNIEDLCYAYWGKHTFLAIIENELASKAKDYINRQINYNLLKAITFFQNIPCRIIGEPNRTLASLPKNLNLNFSEGYISNNRRWVIENFEKALNSFFKFYSSDIVGVKYVFTPKEKKTYYQLFSQRIIEGEVRDVTFDLESSGIKNLINILPFLITACNNGVVAVDEIENSIHELLVQKIICDIQDSITGQLILTTHCVSLLEESKKIKHLKERAYVIGHQHDGTKVIKSLNQCNTRIFPNTNMRLQYLAGRFLGTPKNNKEKFDFKNLIEAFNSK